MKKALRLNLFVELAMRAYGYEPSHRVVVGKFEMCSPVTTKSDRSVAIPSASQGVIIQIRMLRINLE